MSSQDFIRSLKASSDPPQPNGPSKLEIARAGWANNALYVPRKDEVIADWILTRLHKDHGSSLDCGLWILLADVLSCPQLPLKTWLPPLLARINLLNAINHLLTGLSKLGENARETLLDSACAAISQLWPFAARKFNVDALHESFGTLVETLKVVDLSEPLKRLSVWISNAFRAILSSSSTKKKVFTTYTQKHLVSWSECILKQSFRVGDVVYETGVEILFNLDLIRQWDDNEKILFEALRSARSSTLPLLLTSYMAAIKRLRGALFGQTSNQRTYGDVDNIRQAASRFFLSCQGIMETMEKTDTYWSTQTGLVQVLAQGAYYADQQELEEALHKLVDFAATSLKSCGVSEDDKKTAATAAQTLQAITSVEYNTIAPAISRILSHIVVIPSTSDSHYNFLDGILEHYSRTRTVNEYIHLLLALPFDTIRSSAENYKDVVSTTVTSPLMHPRNLEQLTKCVATFLTPTQILPLFQHLTSRIRVCSDEFISAQDGVKLKRQSNANASGDPLAALESASLRLLLICRLSFPVITSLPLNHLAAGAHSKYNETLVEFYAFLGSTITKALKYFNKHSASKSPAAQASATAIAAVLRSAYVLRQRHSELRTCPSEKLMSRLQAFTGDKDLIAAYPQLSIEAFRYYLDHVEHWNGFDGVGCIVEFLALTMDSGAWNVEASILMQTLCQRWLPVLDCYATPEHLDTFVRVLFGQAVDSLQFCLTSGAFWELATLRDHILSYVGKATEPSKNKKSSRTAAAASLFRVLLSFPSDYFPRPLKLELLKRARLADSILVSAGMDVLPTLESDLTTLRTFALRTMTSLGLDQSVDDTPACIEELLAIPIQDPTLLEVTLGLIRLYLSSAVTHGTEATLRKLLTVDVKVNTFMDENIHAQYVLLVADVISKEAVPSKFSTEIINVLEKLRSNLVDALESRLKTTKISQTSNDQLRQALVGWQHALRLSRWFGQDKGPTLALYGPRMCLHCMQSDGASQALVDASINVLKEEVLLSEPGQRSTLLDILLESYIMLSGAHAIDLGGHMSEVMRQLSVDEYARATAAVQERLLNPATPHLDCVVSLAAIMLQDNPKDTFQHVQSFIAACFTAFGNPSLLQLPPVRSQVCSLVLNRCRERAAVLRTIDANAIWSIISGLLAGSSKHESTTSKQVFHDIVGILTALVRHRRDIVIQSLPHLSECLRKLLLLMRRPKPQLGGKQSAMISDAFPIWLSSSDPLDAEEAKALSRLLEALLTKTIIRTYSSSTETAKAESLAKAFGKHAPFVITAFIEAITHPLCVFPANVRKELQPGLFALCEIMNEHDRNALMVTTLGVNGRLMMKTIWKEYEKQRYVGRG